MLLLPRMKAIIALKQRITAKYDYNDLSKLDRILKTEVTCTVNEVPLLSQPH